MSKNELHDLFKNYNDGVIRTSTSSVATGSYKHYSCYATHPALKVGAWQVYGGSCGNPVVENADIYVGLDSSMRRAHHYPWNDGPQVVNVFFPITDGTAPKDIVEFKKMITWLALQLSAGKLIHIGCIGGHGRTGIVMAALVKEVTGNVDATQYVRDNYCNKAVESQSQVLFLFNEYGINKVEGSHATRASAVSDSYGGGKKWDSHYIPPADLKAYKSSRSSPGKITPTTPLGLRPSLPAGRFDAHAVDSLCSVWARGIVSFDKRAESVNIETTQEGV